MPMEVTHGEISQATGKFPGDVSTTFHSARHDGKNISCLRLSGENQVDFSTPLHSVRNGAIGQLSISTPLRKLNKMF